jgi:hypothetical protein
MQRNLELHEHEGDLARRDVSVLAIGGVEWR